MAIPKQYKKQLKAALNKTPTKTPRKRSLRSDAKTKMTWSFSVGDLVEYEGMCGVIVESNGDGFYCIMSPGGKTWKKAAKLRKIQETTKA